MVQPCLPFNKMFEVGGALREANGQCLSEIIFNFFQNQRFVIIISKTLIPLCIDSVES